MKSYEKAKTGRNPKIFRKIIGYMWAEGQKGRRLQTFIFHCLRLFHSPILRSLSFMTVYIPSFQVLRGRPRFFLPSSFQWIIIFGSGVGSILSTWPYPISCFLVMSSNIISCASIFLLIYSFVFLSSLDTLADLLNASIPVALIFLLSWKCNASNFILI